MVNQYPNLKLTLLAGLLVAAVVVGSGFALGVRPSFIRGAAAEDPYARCSVSDKQSDGDQISLIICESGKPLPPGVEQRMTPGRPR
jgi:hypothetical protein